MIRKLFMMMMLALAVTLVASGNTPIPGYDWTTFEGANFTISYPDAMVETYAGDDIMNARSEDETIALNASYDDYGPRVDQLKTVANNCVYMMEQSGAEVDEPIIEGKMLMVRSVKDGVVSIYFTVLKEDGIGVIGNLDFPLENESDWASRFKGIIESITFK